MTRAALFDVDGTLVDTNYLHVTAWWEAIRQSGQEASTAALHHAVGLGSGDLLAHVLGEDRDRDQDEAISTAHKALYGTYFERLRPLDGARDLLRALAGRGWRVLLVTSASGHELTALRASIDADDAITDTASSDDVSEGKPSPEPVEHARELAGAPAAQTVFVGDSVWDMRAATRAGVTPLALLSGGIPQRDLEDAGARGVYRDPADLLAQLGTSAFARREQDAGEARQD